MQETKESGWIFDKINAMKIRIFKTGELNGSSYGKLPFGSSALKNIKNYDKNCYIWSILAKKLHLCENDHPNRVSKYRQDFDELNIDGLIFQTDMNAVMFKNLRN